MSWEFDFLYLLQRLHTPILDKIMIFITTLGDAGLIWILLAIAFLVTKKYRKCGLTMAISLFIMVLFGNLILKNVIMRDRPCWIDTNVLLLIKNPHDYSFPSGHTYASITSAIAIWLWHKKEGIFAIFIAILISFSRLYLFVHFPTDVLMSCILGVITAWISYYFVKKYFDVIIKTFLERKKTL